MCTSTTRAHLVRAGLGALVSVLTMTLAACGDPEPDVPKELLRVLPDFTNSALAENGSDVNAAAFNHVTDIVAAMKPGQTLEINGFTNRPGQECDPIVLPFPVQANAESTTQLREDLLDALPALWADHAACVRDPDTGMDEAGSGVFGAMVMGATTDTTDLVAVYVISDFCTFNELAPLPETCTSKVLDSPDGPQRLVDSMPTALKPRIDVPLHLLEAGRGTNLTATQQLALRSVLTLWGTETGARITFDE